MSSPTLTLYAALKTAFDYLNERLFGGRLPLCLITLRPAARDLIEHSEWVIEVLSAFDRFSLLCAVREGE